MSFANPWAFLLMVVVLGSFLVRWIFPARAAIGFGSFLPIPKDLRARWLAQVPNVLRHICLACLVVVIARPQANDPAARHSTDGIDIVMAIDTSGSMRALDLEVNGERHDRLYAVRDVLQKFVEQRQDDRIGFVVFGAEAFTQAPLTLDHEILKKFLDEIEIGMAGDATAIGDAIAVSASRLHKIQGKSRIIILLTDGRNTAGDVDPMAAAEAAASLGLRIYTIGVGAKGMIPYPMEGPFGRTLRYIESDLDEESLKKIAERSGGQYFRAYDSESLRQVYQNIDRLEKAKLDKPPERQKNELFVPWLLLALAVLLSEWLWLWTPWQKVPV